ncbi:hypothetical protein [Paraburkholderia oxyphila]|uniref:hypothetical protein n=1 Tax=Paraburkholderia oxyphila TaxID=614212 RepID=UPI0012ED9869|nr:hypothetical protein [Paraburkholderia oxyphila]
MRATPHAVEWIPPLYAAVASARMTRRHALPIPHPNNNSIRQIENISFSLRFAPKRRLIDFSCANLGRAMHRIFPCVLSAQRRLQFQRNFYFRHLMMRLIVISPHEA